MELAFGFLLRQCPRLSEAVVYPFGHSLSRNGISFWVSSSSVPSVKGLRISCWLLLMTSVIRLRFSEKSVSKAVSMAFLVSCYFVEEGDAPAMKRGRPPILVTEEVLERRRLSRQRVNASQPKREDPSKKRGRPRRGVEKVVLDTSSISTPMVCGPSSQGKDRQEVLSCIGPITRGCCLPFVLPPSFTLSGHDVLASDIIPACASNSTAISGQGNDSTASSTTIPTSNNSPPTTSAQGSDVPRRKRGRPPVPVTPELLEWRRLSRQKVKVSRPKFQDDTSVEENEPLSSAPACGSASSEGMGAEFTCRHVGTDPKGYSICCGKGKVQLPLLREPPPELGELISSGGQRSRGYFNKSRVYNNIFTFCSFGGNVDHSVNNGKGPFVFRVSGRTYHNIGSLVPPDRLSPKFAQLYMYDAQEALTHRVNFPGKMGEVDPVIVAMLQEMLERDNALVGMFKQLRHRFTGAQPEPINLRILERRTTDGRFENLPTANDYEFAALVVDNDFANCRDVVAEHKKGGLQYISELHPSYMSLQ
ncbi:hypothetical protein POM88_039229 [Heracleum sosnowskyi]|uniref:Helitron helicase-like domain-containing protein n=1 Tax=Heracleum sosnowskyi TaxID=360622 RepID=A0AAD8HBW2_9APIA|nr:hypothetical protein POM88_039229 [Heracleum sosnowskyi]